ISAPDEISALAYCVGASMRGFKSMTATSGPGWALMIETFQYALMTETPLVTAMVQRLGPSTGGATQGAQGDIFLTEFATSGGYTVPMLCPSTPKECFELTTLAFAWAEKLRTPVILLSDKEVGMTSERVDVSTFSPAPVIDRAGGVPHSGWKMYGFGSRDEVPSFMPVGGDQKITITGSAHNKHGQLKKNDSETIDVLLHLEEKITARRHELSAVTMDLEEGASTLLLSYGITARTMRETVRTVRRSGKKVSAMSIQSLFPIPEQALLAACAGAKRVVIAEENLNGQYRLVLMPLLKDKEVVGVNKIGTMITPSEIEVAIV
ncbi:MAG: hypothetical protein NTV54_04140, partial [Ignavibacteriales bacterium]|nr:hypothetical protein [Ignavibacteriales bacterium]